MPCDNFKTIKIHSLLISFFLIWWTGRRRGRGKRLSRKCLHFSSLKSKNPNRFLFHSILSTFDRFAIVLSNNRKFSLTYSKKSGFIKAKHWFYKVNDVSLCSLVRLYSEMSFIQLFTDGVTSLFGKTI